LLTQHPEVTAGDEACTRRARWGLPAHFMSNDRPRAPHMAIGAQSVRTSLGQAFRCRHGNVHRRRLDVPRGQRPSSRQSLNQFESLDYRSGLAAIGGKHAASVGFDARGLYRGGGAGVVLLLDVSGCA